jgi:hypothetical protein
MRNVCPNLYRAIRRRDKTRRDKRQDKTRPDQTKKLDKTRQDKTRQDRTRQDKTRRFTFEVESVHPPFIIRRPERSYLYRKEKKMPKIDKTWTKARQGKAGQGKARPGKTRQDKAKQT